MQFCPESHAKILINRMGPIQSIRPAIKAPITCYEARMLIKVDKSKQKCSSLIQYGAIQKIYFYLLLFVGLTRLHL